MNILECEQGSEAWYAARLGIPTASRFDRIVTATGKRSSAATKLRAELLAEYIRGEAAETIQTEAMTRGVELESRARAMYELETGHDVRQVGGLFLDETKTIMASPDGIMPELSRGLEIKCPKLGTHIQYCIERVLPEKYTLQVMGNLWISGYDTWDFVSFCPEFPSEPLFKLAVPRDEKLIAAMAEQIIRFSKTLEADKKALEVDSCQA